MSTINIPGFDAEAALVKTCSQYRSAGAWSNRNGGNAASQIVPTLPFGFRDCPGGLTYSCRPTGWSGYHGHALYTCGCFPPALPVSFMI